VTELQARPAVANIKKETFPSTFGRGCHEVTGEGNERKN